MTRIRPVDLSGVDGLGPRARGCAFWETEAPTPPADPTFEKEAWISHVLLQWGVCGQLAEEPTRTGQGAPLASAFYAPPGMVPRAGGLPTAPVGADAILLTGLREEREAPAGVLTVLLEAVVADLRARGVHALESYGLRADADPDTQDDSIDESALTPADFLVEHGFTVVARHARYPRLRLEIDGDHRWKADVERALDLLFAEPGVAGWRTRELVGVGTMSAALRPAGSVRSR